jgi:hypothetical protein
MKTKNIISLSVIFALIAVSSGCGRVETYGEPISNRNLTAINDIVAHPADYIGKTVTVKGKIILVCETGCWFNLKEAGAVIYVNIEPSGFAIPQNAGRHATVEGKILSDKGKLTLVGKGVEIK